MSSEWKSEERIRWQPEEDQFLLNQIKIHPRESHMDLARKIITHPLVAGRSIGAVEQRTGWMRAKMRSNNSSLVSPDNAV